MTELEKHALRRVIENLKYPTVPNSAYDANFKRMPDEVLVPGRSNHSLLEDEVFEAGYRRGYSEMAQMITFVMTASREQLIKYAGKPSRKPPKKGTT